MGACLNFRRTTISLDTLPHPSETDADLENWSEDISYTSIFSGQDKSYLVLPKSDKSTSMTSETVSQIIKYFASKNVILFNGSGLFSSAAASSDLTSRSSFFMHQPTLTEITPLLFLGSFENAKNEQELLANGITHIITVIGPKNPIKGIKHKHCPMNDSGKSDLGRIMITLSPFILESQQPGNKLFVHCLLGQNRSASVVIAILMSQGKTLCEAFKMVKIRRQLVQINERYAKQLARMEFKLFGEISVPNNWMEIRSVDMETGKVVFCGENVDTPFSTIFGSASSDGKSTIYDLQKNLTAHPQYQNNFRVATGGKNSSGLNSIRSKTHSNRPLREVIPCVN